MPRESHLPRPCVRRRDDERAEAMKMWRQAAAIFVVAVVGLAYGVCVTGHARAPPIAGPYVVGRQRFAPRVQMTATLEGAVDHHRDATAAATVSGLRRSTTSSGSTAAGSWTWEDAIRLQGPDAAGLGFVDCGSESSRHHHWTVRAGWQVIRELLQHPMPPPTTIAATITTGRVCKRDSTLLDIAALPKIVHTHRRARPKEHAPHDLLLRFLHDNVDNATLLVTAPLTESAVDDAVDVHHSFCVRQQPAGVMVARGDRSVLQADTSSTSNDADVVVTKKASHNTSSKRSRTSLRNSYALELGDPHHVVVVASHKEEGDATRQFVVYPQPLSFSDDAQQFPLQKQFGLWHTHFQPRGEAFDISTAEYPQFAKPAPPAFVALFSNAIVTDGNVVTCNRGYTTGACMWNFRVFGNTEVGAVIPLEHRHPSIVALCDYWCNGYFHFTHEHLPRLALVHHMLMADRSMKVTVPRNVGYIKAYLIDVLGLQPQQLLSTSGTYLATEQAVYPQPQRCGSIFTPTLMLLRDIVFTRLGGLSRHLCDGERRTATALPLVLWAERKKLSRMPRNYFDIRAEIEANYTDRLRFLDTIGMNVTEQIRAFNQADIVIGPHGANIANAMWMRHGATLVEFVSYRYANMCYYGTAARLAVSFGAVFHGALKHGHYNSSAEEVARHIEYHFRSAPACTRNPARKWWS